LGVKAGVKGVQPPTLGERTTTRWNRR